MNRVLYCAVLTALTAGSASAQVSTERLTGPVPNEVKESSAAPLAPRGGCVAIPDDGYDGTIGSMACLLVPDPNNGETIAGVSVNVTAEHTWVGDLVVKVVAPGGTVGTLMSRPGFAEPADDGTGCCGDSSNLILTSPIEFDDLGGGPSAELMGGSIADGQFVCQDDGECSFVSNPGAAVGSGLADFVGLTASGGDWQVCMGDSASSDTGNLCDASIDFVTGSPADLSIAKTAPDGVVEEMGPYSFQLDVANAGPGDHAAVTVTDTLPANVAFTGSSCGASAVGQDVTWNVGALASGANASCELFVNNTVAGCPTVSNTAFVTGDVGTLDPPGNNSSTFANAPPGGNVILDPSFEGGTPNPDWTEASTNFGTPICDAGACGTGAGTTGPLTGAFWVWFGGAGGALEVGSVEQSVVIPAGGSAALEFGYWLGVCTGGANDFVRALIDGNEVWRADGNSPDCGDTGYSLESVDVSAFADGGAHLVRFESTSGTAGTNTNFSIDDVTLTIAGEPVCTVGQGGGELPEAVVVPAFGRIGLLLTGVLVLGLGLVVVRRF